ncbi:unnamed protein product [Protopolystoma xenopodis]|uniref:Uncharacterized protein n=1 Tax=Protopolystoma xenopodis TaxID=117903 RepID=A0A3S5BDY4_9PLAT|nr:unnamed protein product [Protopolystoma xenopodis]
MRRHTCLPGRTTPERVCPAPVRPYLFARLAVCACVLAFSRRAPLCLFRPRPSAHGRPAPAKLALSIRPVGSAPLLCFNLTLSLSRSLPLSLSRSVALFLSLTPNYAGQDFDLLRSLFGRALSLYTHTPTYIHTYTHRHTCLPTLSLSARFTLLFRLSSPSLNLENILLFVAPGGLVLPLASLQADFEPLRWQR